MMIREPGDLPMLIFNQPGRGVLEGSSMTVSLCHCDGNSTKRQSSSLVCLCPAATGARDYALYRYLF